MQSQPESRHAEDAERWLPEEEPGFQASTLQGPLVPAEPARGRELRLAATRRRAHPLPRRPPSAKPASGWFGRIHFLPVFYVAALSVLGYTFATRSISAFSTAWRSTETLALSHERNSPGGGPSELASDDRSLDTPPTRSFSLQGLLPLFPAPAHPGQANPTPPTVGRPGSFE